jgi:hypothetical protein
MQPPLTSPGKSGSFWLHKAYVNVDFEEIHIGHDDRTRARNHPADRRFDSRHTGPDDQSKQI